MNITDIFKRREEIEGTIGNAIGDYIDVEFIGHFNNAPQLYISMKKPNNPGVILFPALGEGQCTVGYIIDGILRVLGLKEEDGIKFKDIRNFPMRVIHSGDGGWGSKIIAFGNLVDDTFVLVDDLNRYAFDRIKELKES